MHFASWLSWKHHPKTAICVHMYNDIRKILSISRHWYVYSVKLFAPFKLRFVVRTGILRRGAT